MQVVTINGTPYNIPLSWDDEVTYKQAIDVIKNVDDKAFQLNILSGIPLDSINRMPDFQVAKLFELISFTENLEVFDSVEVLDKYKEFDFGSIEYGGAEKVRKILNTNSSGFEVAIGIIKELVNFDITNEPFLKVIGTANFFLSKSIISTIASVNLTKVNELLNKNKLALTDSKNLAALQHTLNSQEVTP